MTSNLDNFNRVSSTSQLTHQNLLSTLEKLFPNQDSGQNNLKCEIAPTIDSINYGLINFILSKRTQFSLVLCNGKIEKRVNSQTNKEFSEATGGSHWTTLHFRKDHNNNIDAFYADSLNPNSTSVPENIKDKLKTLGINESNIHKMKCQNQGINQCGDYSAFNAKAMDQMSLNDLKKGSIKENITEKNVNTDVKNFSLNLRQALEKEFNNNSIQQNPSEGNQKSLLTTLKAEEKSPREDQIPLDSLEASVIDAQSNAINSYKNPTLIKYHLTTSQKDNLENIAIDMAIQNSLKEISSKISSPSSSPLSSPSSSPLLNPQKQVAKTRILGG